MFGFLNTTVLLAAGAALIPLIIHLFSRRRVKVVEFSSLRHLKQMQRRQLRRLKIRQWLLLLLRMLIILAAVLAFARPTLKEGTVGSHAAVAAVILLDNSASVNRVVADGNLYELAVRRTENLLKSFKQSDRVALLPLDLASGQDAGRFASAAAAEEQLHRINCGSGRADWRTQLARAGELLGAEASLNRELYVVADRQRSSLPEDALTQLNDVKLCLVDLPLEDADNVGLVSLDLGGQLIQPGRDFDIVATIANHSSDDSGDRIASLFLDGQRVAQTDFTVPAGGETSVRFTRSVARTGFHSGYVELSDDRFAGDNRRYFSFNLPDQFNVLIVGDDRAAQFVALALNPPTTSGQYWSVKTAAPGELSGVDFNGYDVIMLIGAPELTTQFNSRLASAVSRGHALFITYGGSTDIDKFNLSWSQLSGVTYSERVRRDFSRAGYYSFQPFEVEHPIFSVFKFPDNRPPEVKFYALPKLAVRPPAQALMTFTGGTPALVEATYERGKVLAFTGPLAPEYSDFVSHGFFVPFISRIAEYLASDLTSLDLDLYAGAAITRSLPTTQTPVYAVDLIGPDSGVVSLPPEEQGGALVVRTEPLAMAGVYRLVSRGREIDRFAVNLAPAEGDLTAADPDQFALALGTREFREIDYHTDAAAAVAGFRVGRELWQVFMWVALVLLALEMLLARRFPSEE